MTDVVEKMARAFWLRERERAALCDDVLSSIRGQAIKPTMEPFEDYREMWIGDARAALDALAESVSEPMLQAACNAVHPAKWHEKRENEMRRAIRAAILAAKG